MKLPGENSSSEVLINYSTYTAVRVAADQDTNPLSTQIIEAYETLETKVNERKRKTKDSSSKIAIRDEKEDHFKASILNLSLEILSVTANNRDDIRYKSLFSKTPSSINSQSIKDKISDAKILVQKLNSNSEDAIYVKHLSLIQKAITELEEADSNYKTAIENEKSSVDFEKLAQNALRNILVKTYGKLIDIKGKKDAEKYFKRSISAKKKDSKENATPTSLS